MLVPALALSLVLIEASPATAETSGPTDPKQGKTNSKPEKKKRVPDSGQRGPTAPEPSTSGQSGYYERDSNKLPVGSSPWFEQMEREGRFSRRP